jgi:hypothetical protein
MKQVLLHGFLRLRRRWEERHLRPHFLLVLFPVCSVQFERFLLCRIIDVRVRQQILNANENLLHCERSFPILILREDAEANRAGRVDVGMEQRRNKLALGTRETAETTKV